MSLLGLEGSIREHFRLYYRSRPAQIQGKNDDFFMGARAGYPLQVLACQSQAVGFPLLSLARTPHS
jgi:hypothetical protein